MKLYSEPDVGTTLKLYLPATMQIDHAAVVTQIPEAPRGSEKRVLLVEDRADVREMVSDQLISLDYRVLAAESAKQAMALVQRAEPIDLLLTDVLLGNGSNGVTLAGEVRKQRPNLPVVYMTGHVGGGTLGERIRAEHGRVLEKPFTRAQLASALAEALAISRAIQGEVAAP